MKHPYSDDMEQPYSVQFTHNHTRDSDKEGADDY